jgi:serum/glucocorticoid-regulated kinase 2
LKSEANYVLEEKRPDPENDPMMTSLETEANSNPSLLHTPLSTSRKMSSLVIKEGEELLFSKKINIDSFDIEKVIGKGGYGKVFLVTKSDTNQWYAMKEIKKESLASEKEKANTIFERVILQNVSSPFIVKLHYAFQTPEKLYYVLDFCSGGELFFHLKKQFAFKEKKARFYAAECILALEELHRNDIIYRDLKPENILLEGDGHIKLTDFGLSKYIGDSKHGKWYTFAGTPEYVAPEIVSDKGYGKEVDWWSLGAILYEMLVGVQPFHHKNQQKLLDNILFKDLRFPEVVSKSAKDLLTKLLERRPERRLGHGENGATAIKSHKFFSSIDWQKLEAREVVPPFKPKTKFEGDSRNFDKEFTNQRVEGSSGDCKMSIKEKESTYIRDFTYYTAGSDIKNGKLDINKVFESNLKNVDEDHHTNTGKFDDILEVASDDEVSNF